MTTHVKQTQEQIRDVVKRNDLRSKDVEAKQRQEDFFSLQRMKQWCVSCTTRLIVPMD